MASTDILGLFTSPEQYQQQQDLMMQRQAAELAQLDPYSSIRYGAIRAGQQFGRGLAGILGAEDPQLRMISTRQSALQGINLNDPESIFTAARQLADAGDQQGALMLADYGRKAASEVALAQQRSRAERAAATPKELQIAAAKADLQQRIRQLQALPESEERNVALQNATDMLSNLAASVKTEGLVREQQIARDLALEAGAEGTPDYNTAYRKALKDLTNKESQQKLGEFERVLNARYPDTPENAEKRAVLMDQFLTSEITGRKAGKGTQIDLGGIRVDTSKAGEAAGKQIGVELVDVKGKESALDSIAEAKNMLKQGIYAGAYGPTKQFVAKYTGVGSPDKVANTETFLAFIGETVVPRLKEFGGNDSEQELAYLNRIMGGDTSVEPKTLERILNQAEIKIKRGIERLRRQAESGEKKQPLTSTLPPPETPAAPAAAPRPTKRWNPTTRKLEAVQ
jgi:hypothetical protein